MLLYRRIVLSQTNCYLLKARKGYLMIDCGNCSDKNAFLHKIRKLSVDPSEIQYLFLTHHHSDHCGLLHFLTSINKDIQIIMSKECSRYLETGRNFSHQDEQYSNPLLGKIIDTYSRFSKSMTNSFEPYFTRSSDIIIEADNHDILPGIGINGSILHTPGHTEDSISMVIGETAFLGDAARNMLNFTGTPYLPILIYNKKECCISWIKLINAGARLFIPGNGKPFDIIDKGTVLMSILSQSQTTYY